MKWIRHQTDTWDDERIAQLVEAGGKEGLALYGAYWRVLEILARQMEGPAPTCSVQYSVSRWSVLLSVRGSHVSHYLGHLAKNGLVTVECLGSDIKVTNRKLLKYRDEYSRKSGHKPEDVRPKEEKTDRTTTQELPDGDGITPDMVASRVLVELKLSGKELRNILDEVCRREMSSGKTADTLYAELTDAYTRYQQAKPRLAFTVLASKFFGELWTNPAAWPWKEGEAPKRAPVPAAAEGIKRPNRVLDIRSMIPKAGVQ